jgi:hypothetical protein
LSLFLPLHPFLRMDFLHWCCRERKTSQQQQVRKHEHYPGREHEYNGRRARSWWLEGNNNNTKSQIGSKIPLFFLVSVTRREYERRTMHSWQDYLKMNTMYDILFLPVSLFDSWSCCKLGWSYTLRGRRITVHRVETTRGAWGS